MKQYYIQGVGARRASHFHLASDKSRSRCLRSPFTDDTGCRVSSLGHDGASLEHARRRRGVVSVAKSRASHRARLGFFSADASTGNATRDAPRVDSDAMSRAVVVVEALLDATRRAASRNRRRRRIARAIPSRRGFIPSFV
jgi:hypothetical protein